MLTSPVKELILTLPCIELLSILVLTPSRLLYLLSFITRASRPYKPLTVQNSFNWAHVESLKSSFISKWKQKVRMLWQITPLLWNRLLFIVVVGWYYKFVLISHGKVTWCGTQRFDCLLQVFVRQWGRQQDRLPRHPRNKETRR